MDANRMLSRHPDAVEAEVDGQRVLMSPKDFDYFGLEGTGAAVWDRLTEATALDDLVTALAADFSADPDVVRTDVVEFISALDAAGLLAAS